MSRVNQHTTKANKSLYQNEEWMRKQYLDKELSTHNIAKLVGLASGTTVLQWLRRFNIPTRKQIGQPREKNFRWKGGQYISPNGYRFILIDDKNHIRAVKKGSYSVYVPEHILVMEKHLGRRLTKTETVHHRNGIKLDNRIINLKLFGSGQKEHHQYEQKILLFAKRLIWGDIKPELRAPLKKLFDNFSRND